MMNASRQQSSASSHLVFPDTFDMIFENDAEWFSLASSQSFAPGPMNFSFDTQNSGYGSELDAVEQNASDAMMIDDIVKVEPALKDVRDIPERFHDVPQALVVKNLPISSLPKGKAKSTSPQVETTLTFSSEEDDDSCAPRGKKRPRIEIDLPDPTTIKNVKTISEKLTALDSESFQDFIDRLESIRKLTSAEQTEVKKMRRRINNRESARKSRQDKREHTDLLDQHIRDLTDQLHQTKLEMASLAQENSSLRNEIAFSYQLIAANPVLRQLYADLKAKHEAKRGTTN